MLLTFLLPAKASYALAKIYMYAAVINQNIVHLEVCIFTCLSVLKLYECIL